MPLRNYQLQALDKVQRFFDLNVDKRKVILVSPTGCHRKGQEILMASGAVKKVEEICVGDILLGADSQPRTVLSLCRGEGQMYEIHPTKGTPFVVNEDHILTLVETEKGTIVDVSVKDWLGWGKTKKHTHKLFRRAADFTSKQRESLPLDPYFLGVLLGDGSFSGCVTVTTPEPEILAEVHSQAQKFGLSVSISGFEDTAPSYRLVQKKGGLRIANPIAVILGSLGVWKIKCEDRFVPDVYKTGSSQQRSEILAGLIDTDGSLSTGCVDYISKSQRLAEDVAFLSRSLGFAAYVTPCEKFCQTGNGGTYYRVSISGELSKLPCRVPRKKAPARLQKKNPLRTGFSVEKLGVEPFFGFTLDGDGRYLLSDFTVTHNSGKTAMGAEYVKRAVSQGKSVLWLAHRRELITQASQRIAKDGLPDHGVILAGHPVGNKNALLQVASVDTLRSRNIRPPADHIVWDECHHTKAVTWSQIQSEYPEAYSLGLTATPCRGDGAPLGDVFDGMVVAATIRQLQKAGYLVPCRIIAPSKNLGSKKLARDPLHEWQARAQGKQTVVFLNTLQECYALCHRFKEAGAKAAVVEADTPVEERAAILEKFAAKELDVLCNVAVLTEGWDNPGAEVGIVARSVGHLGLWMQIVGRFLRPSPGKKFATILDLAGNVHLHGLPEAKMSFSLEGGIIQADHDKMRICPYCGVMIERLPCIHCGKGKRVVPQRVRIEEQDIFEVLRPPPGEDGRSEKKRWREDALYLARYAAHQRLEREWIYVVFQQRHGKSMDFDDRYAAEAAHQKTWLELFEEVYDPLPPVYHTWTMYEMHKRQFIDRYVRPLPNLPAARR